MMERRAARLILQGARELLNAKMQELRAQADAVMRVVQPVGARGHAALLSHMGYPLEPALAWALAHL